MTLRASSSLPFVKHTSSCSPSSRERGARFALPFAERAVLVLERSHVLLAARELLFHLAHRVLQQHVRFLDAVEHGVHVRREQPRHSIDECHEIFLLGSWWVATRGPL